MSEAFPQVRLSAQRALLHYVPWNLRGVSVSLRKCVVEFRFYFDGEITQAEKEIADAVVIAMRSDYVDPEKREMQFTHAVCRSDFPARPPMLDDEYFVYFRYEDDIYPQPPSSTIS